MYVSNPRLPLLTIAACLPSFRSADDLILAVSAFSGVPAFIELLDVDAVMILAGPTEGKDRDGLALNSGFRQRGLGSLRPCAELVERTMEQDTKSSDLKIQRPPDTPVLLRAINATLRALEDRGRFFRNLIVAVVMVAGTSVLLAVIFLRWMPLFGFILAIPLVGGFLILDNRRVRCWRSEILQMFRTEAFDYSLFKKTMAGFRHLPAGTVRSMLAMLPEQVDGKENAPEGRKEDEFEAATRRHEQKILATTLLLTLALSAMASAIFYRSGILLLCGLGLVLLFTVFRAR